MGEVADMMINGDLCESCGVYLEGEGEGFPRYCRSCNRPDQDYRASKPCKTKAQCYICHKWVKSIGLPQHIRDAHKAAIAEDKA